MLELLWASLSNFRQIWGNFGRFLSIPGTFEVFFWQIWLILTSNFNVILVSVFFIYRFKDVLDNYQALYTVLANFAQVWSHFQLFLCYLCTNSEPFSRDFIPFGQCLIDFWWISKCFGLFLRSFGAILDEFNDILGHFYVILDPF